MFQKEVKNIKKNILEMVNNAGSGHPTSSLSSLHIMIYLFFSGIFKTEWKTWDDPKNDQFILSKGHATPLLYSLYYELGLVNGDDMQNYRQINGRLEGHPTPRNGLTKVTSGSLGMGINIGNGICIGNKMRNNTAKTYVLCGDSEIAEGSVWEGINFAVHNKLTNLVVMVDVNRLGQRGETMENGDLEIIANKFSGFGANVIKCTDGHDFKKIEKAFKAIDKDSVNVILFKTIKGWGIDAIADKNGWHGKPIPQEYINM